MKQQRPPVYPGLILAAPELLEILQEILETYDQTGCIENDTWKKADQIISKAKGTEQ